MPPKVWELERDLARVGLRERSGRGSHRNWVHPGSRTRLTVSGHAGDDAKRYQIRQVRAAIEESKR